MLKYKNLILIIVSIILFVYAGFISIFPSVYTDTFNKEKFQEKSLSATGLDISFEKIDVKIRPNFKTIIKVENLLVQYPDKQPLLKIKSAQMITTPAALLSKKYKVKALYLRHVKYDDQILPNKENKIAFLSSSFDPSYYGSKKITIIPEGSIYVNGIDLSYTVCEPYSYKTEYIREAEYTQEQVKEFLSSLDFRNIIIK